ncbi:endo alpha-1,4 polygalactosaminidase [Pelomonas saccharophila]|nr:endo alpha-1,4 polygalactosaminidase [Roseateles saccharophilus]
MQALSALMVGCAGTALLAGCGGGADAASTNAGGTGTPATAPTPASSPSTWWKPIASDTWQWQLRGTVNTSYTVVIYDIDLFDNSAAAIAQLKTSGRKIVCYFSAGSSENWRPDNSHFTAADMGSPLSGWPGENWLDTRSANVRRIMATRLDLAQSKGCDGVEPDNVDGYANNTSFPLTAQDQLDYNRFLADEAHKRWLAVALKNDVGQLSDLEPSFDLAINEQCHQYSECDGYSVFISKNKPVLNAEYDAKYQNNTGGARDSLCAAAHVANMRTLVLPLQLDDTFRYSCEP